MSTSLALVGVVCDAVRGFAGLLRLNGAFYLGGLGAAGLAEHGEQDDASTRCQPVGQAVCRRSTAVAAFEGADPAFASGAPFDGAPKGWSVFLGLSRLGWCAFAGDDDVADAEVVQGVVDILLAVAAVGGDDSRRAAGASWTRSMAGGRRACGPALLAGSGH
jgi:hypothetical protein